MGSVDLQAAIAAGNEAEVVEALREVPNGRSGAAAIESIKKLASETCSAAVRNAAALALLDCGAPGAADLLIELVGRPETRGSRGTLLYVLAELNAKVPLPVLLDVFADDGYEARAEALGLLADCDYPSAQVDQALPALRAIAASTDSERAEHACEAIAILTSAD